MSNKVASPPARSAHPSSLGASYLGNGRCRFLVWAAKASRVDLKLLGPGRLLPMTPIGGGYFQLLAENVNSGSHYFYRLDDGQDRPDPASRFQPEGIHGPSAVVDPQFDWTDASWGGISQREYVTYELHVGTFTPDGTFDGAIHYLDELKDIGITAVELMPVAQFPGGRNWGYDGVHPFAVQNTYGGPRGLKGLVDACHARDLAVVLDVVYNHLGPEGNYLGEFGDYFTNRYRTPWGSAINFDGRHSDDVRRFFVENALYWIDEFHIDALRLDAVHAIFDYSARPFLRELADAVRLEGRRLGRHVFTIAESNLNDARLLASNEQGGFGLDGQWCDDFHHSLHSALTGERAGCYEDFHGLEDLGKAYRDGYVLDGRYSAYRGRRHGGSGRDIPPAKLTVCSQNHDQVGNRPRGERMTELVSFEQLKLAAAAVLLSPYQPLLFMGEEYGESAPFHYFVSHTDPGLVDAVRRGRKQRLAQLGGQGDPPDPWDETTFQRSKLDHGLKKGGHHQVLRDFYKTLIALRKRFSPLALADRDRLETTILRPGCVLAVRRWSLECEILTVFHFGEETLSVQLPLPLGAWNTLLDSADRRWQGPGSELPTCVESSGKVSCRIAPHSVAVFARQFGLDNSSRGD